jgi:hypothetical protein
VIRAAIIRQIITNRKLKRIYRRRWRDVCDALVDVVEVNDKFSVSTDAVLALDIIVGVTFVILIDGITFVLIIVSVVVFEDAFSINSVVVVMDDDVLGLVYNVFSIIFEVALDIVVGIICSAVVV